MPEYHAIAIDGPSGAGKSTVAKILAARLGFIYIDTGAMYRTAALHCLNSNIDFADEAAVCGALAQSEITIKHDGGAQHIYLNGADVTSLIRTPIVSDGSSKVAVLQCVRERLAALQRRLAQNENVVMDGRDIGTNVLPGAMLKIYLDATVSQRTKRRLQELEALGERPDFASLAKEIEQRDFRDANRAHSPLRKAPGSVTIDSSGMTQEQVAEKIELMYKKMLER